MASLDFDRMDGDAPMDGEERGGGLVCEGVVIGLGGFSCPAGLYGCHCGLSRGDRELCWEALRN